MDRNQRIMSYFPSENTWEENYRKIIELGRKIPKFNKENKKDKWLIKACQSPLWLKPEIQTSGLMLFSGDSEGLVSRGLLALIIEFYTKKTPEEVLKEQPVFIKELELDQFLSARRTNGLQAILDQIFQYARAFLLVAKASKPQD